MQNSQATSAPDDLVIIERILQGDVNAFEVLLRRYESDVLRVVRRHLPYDAVEETAQDVFVRAYQSLPGFKKKSGFRNWLLSIAVRTCYDFWRKKYRNREIPLSTLSEARQEQIEILLSENAGQKHEETAQKKEAAELLEWALARLSPEDRMVMELVYLEELSGKEAAEMLGWTVANVKIRSYRVRNKLRKMLTDNFGNAEKGRRQ